MAEWLSSLRGAGARMPVKPVVRNNNSVGVHSRQISFHEEPNAMSTASKDDVHDSLDSRAACRNVSGVKSGDHDSTISRFLRTPRRKGLIPVRQASSTGKSQQEQNQESTSPPGSPRASSVKSADDASFATDDDFATDSEGDCVQVCVRVRPVNNNERHDFSHQHCIHVIGTRTLKLFMQKNRSEPHVFHYDNVFTEDSSQQEVFELTGYPVVENCLNGYNSTIFAYGQTGAGKTYTMLGYLGGSDQKHSDMRGLAPRVFDYLFERIAASEDSHGRDSSKYSCRCSFLEIYNETITDLLHPSATNLQIREDIKKGCYVDGLSEESVVNVEEMLALMRRGADNRHVGETRMNRESSRSHSVFTLILERCSKTSNGLTNIVFSRLNLIDLAGSERQKKSEVAGSHLKEACHINKSLTILGRVIHELVEAQRSGRKSHVPYRDSRLTFLLQDSLGGNAKTWIIANVSPSSCCSQETLTTLQFAQRAKRIRNRAVVNIDTRGDIAVLQKEIIRLNQEIHYLRGGVTDAYVVENAQLRSQLKEQQRLHQDAQMKHESVQTEVHRYKRERDRAEDKMQQFTISQGQLLLALSKAESALKMCQTEATAATQKDMEVLQHECRLLTAEKRRLVRQVAEMEATGNDLQLQLSNAIGNEVQCQQLLDHEKAGSKDLQNMIDILQTENARLLGELLAERSRLSSGQSVIDKVGEDLAKMQEQYAAKEAELCAAIEKLATEKDAKDQLAARLQALESHLSAQAMELSAAFSSIKALRSELECSSSDLEAARVQLAIEKAASEQLQDSLQFVNAQVNTAMENLSSTCCALETEQQESSILRQQLGTLQASLSVAHSQIESQAETLQALQTKLISAEKQLADAESAHDQLKHEQSNKADLQKQLHALDTQLLAERKASADSKAAADAAWFTKMTDLQQDVQILRNQLEQQHEEHVCLQAQSQALSEDLKDQVFELFGTLASTNIQLEAERKARKQADATVAQMTHELEAVKQRLTSDKTTSQDMSMQLDSARQHSAELEEEVRKLNHATLKLRDELQSLSDECAYQHAVVEKFKQEHSDLEQVAASLQQDLEAQQRKCKEAEGTITVLRDHLQKSEDNAKCQAEEMQQILSSVKQEYEETVAKHAAAIRSRVEDARQAEEKHQLVCAELENRVAVVEQHVSELTQEKGDLLATLDDKLESLAVLQQENTGLKQQLVTIADKLEDEGTQLKDARAQIRKVTLQLQETEDRVHAAVMESNACAQELEIAHCNAVHAAATATETQHQQQNQIEALQKDLSMAVEQLARQEQEIKQQVHGLAAKLESSKGEVASLQNALSEEQEEIKRLKDTLAKVIASLGKAEKKNVTLDKCVKDLEQQKSDRIANTEAQIRRLSNEMQALQQQLTSANQRLEASYMANTSEAVKVARFAHAFQEMRRVIETAHVMDGVSAGLAPTLEGAPPLASIRGGLRPGVRAGHVLSMSPIKCHTSPILDDSKEAELAGLRDQMSNIKFAQQLRASIDGLADILPKVPIS